MNPLFEALLPSTPSENPQEALALESQRVLQGALDSLESHIALLDENGVIVGVNAAWRRFAKDNNFVGQDTAIGSNYLKICRTAKGEFAEEAFVAAAGIQEVLDGKREGFRLEYPCHGPQIQRWFELQGTRFWGEGAVRVVVAHENITSRKLAEIRLLQETELTETLYHVGQVVAAELDLRKIVQTVTQAATELTGATCGAFVPNHAEEQSLAYRVCGPQTQWTNQIAPLTTAFRDTGVVRADDLQNEPRFNPDEPFWTVPLDGLEVVSYLAAPVVSRSGEVLGGLFFGHNQKAGFNRDDERIVASLAAQAAVAMDNARLYQHAQRERAKALRSEARYRFATETIPQMVWTTDASGFHQYFNARWFDFTGLDAPTSFGEGWQLPLHPDDRERAAKRWKQSLATGEPYEIEYRVRRHDGVFRWFLGRALPQRDENGRILKWFGTCTDIDDQKRAEAERLELLAAEAAARREAETANRLKDEFLAIVSHELRTPLTPILGWTNLLLTEEPDARLRRQAYETIERNARAQAQIVNDLLDVSRIITGKLRLKIRPIDLAGAISEALETVEPSALGKDISLETDLTPDAGQILGDFDRLRQVVWNLATNAIKFTPRGGKIRLLLRRTDSSVELSVSDSGEGIAPEFLPHVFERFRQAGAGSTRPHGGLGLGLSIVRHLVEQHGGSVSVHSAGLGQGATFRVILPLAPLQTEEADVPMTCTGAQNSVAPPKLLANLKVLLVEDQNDAREMLGKVLSQAGAQVESAASAGEGFDKFASFRPDVLLSDIGMPGEDGFAFLKKIRSLPNSQGAKTPAVALTAYAHAEDRAKTLAAGFQEHLAKPIAPDELALVLARVAGRGAR